MFFFKKKTKVKIKYITYLTKVMKYKCVLDKFRLDKAAKQALLLYFFDQTRDDMSRLLTAVNIKYQEVTPDSLLPDGFSLLDARKLEGKNMLKADAIYVLEAHPIHSINIIPLTATENQGLKELIYFTGMDEIVMKAFGSDRIIEMMKKIGVKDDESIEHSMVSNSIERGQKKNESKLKNPIDIRTSQEEWMEKNNLLAMDS